MSLGLGLGLGMGIGLDDIFNPSTHIPAQEKMFTTYEGGFDFGSRQWQYNPREPTRLAIAHIIEARRRMVVCRLAENNNEATAWRFVATHIMNVYSIKESDLHD